ncbi:MAG: hypothetical protein FWF11_00205 [Coriobacteriia bacterium]|nr:hypothetical protein [Coriobacteriia bacterium]
MDNLKDFRAAAKEEKAANPQFARGRMWVRLWTTIWAVLSSTITILVATFPFSEGGFPSAMTIIFLLIWVYAFWLVPSLACMGLTREAGIFMILLSAYRIPGALAVLDRLLVDTLATFTFSLYLIMIVMTLLVLLQPSIKYYYARNKEIQKQYYPGLFQMGKAEPHE